MSHTRVLSDTDTEQLNEVLHAFYEVISFDDGAAPDWERPGYFQRTRASRA